MEHRPKSIRPFIGSKNFAESRRFYKDLGFEESVIDGHMSYFNTQGFGFYLQDAYVKDWIDNTMVFLEVADVPRHHNEIVKLNLPARYLGVRISSIREND